MSKGTLHKKKTGTNQKRYNKSKGRGGPYAGKRERQYMGDTLKSMPAAIISMDSTRSSESFVRS